MSEIINLTPHTLNIRLDLGMLEVPTMGIVARVTEQRAERPAIPTSEGWCAVVSVTYGEVTGLPDPQAGHVYVVSRLVRQALDAAGDRRPDVLCPGPLLRNDAGVVVGCSGLSL